MRVWRIARQIYDPLDGEGPRRIGGRWNSPGRPVVYTAAHLSLSIVEVLVHTDPDLIPDDLTAFEIEVPETATIGCIEPADLPAHWTDIPNHTACRALGDAWLDSGEHPVLAVPSAIVPEETNYLLDPTHPAASGFRVLRSRPFTFDSRLL
jgi:RES domain-containing protein